MNRLPRNRAVVFGIITASMLAVDLWSKTAAFTAFPLRNGGPWLIDSTAVRFRFFTSLNEGALWGFGQGFAWAFALLSVAAFVGVLYWLFVMKAAESLWLTISLAFVSAGTLGNLYDRLGLHGIRLPGQDQPIQAVRDFFHFQFGGTVQNPGLDWAIFNVADICLVCGAGMLMIQSLFAPPEPTTQPVRTES
ncbi:signal peptidase II [Fuerstiella marisgermanici]|uniref:Lipoprotein signal peptidase n=1 Tax=Fuerstiella marisgermanici TaxID=1891926 RepID=A0A1P8WBU5_9PLAN|nr:signal peptidase II [Fuerstiella marisgermanici]APZ91504.1 lipoprotein signal peptidase [Fuerstiella marisgermanici]